jgi:uncharacterized protein (DUF697 family)/tellurite resistance protein
MTETERDATLAICLHASFADGAKDERERAEVQRIAERLSPGGAAGVADLFQDVLLGRRTLESSAAALSTPELRQLAYELAVCVCSADGATVEAERAFLERLRGLLGLAPGPAQEFARQAEVLATTPLGPPGAGPSGPSGAPRAPADPAALDKAILDAAILNGALELLPESLSTMAIIPLQMRLVYRVGQAYGYELDRGHVKDFLATAGVGLASQYVEQVGRKLLGGLLGALGGRMLGGLGRQAVSSATAFASTYALGQVAKKYYGGGRTLTVEALKQAFQEMLGEAQGLRQKYAGEIEQRAKTIDPAKIIDTIRGQ